MNVDFKLVSEKNEKLNEIRKALKTEFFGIDKQIDDIIDSIKTWYLMPEIVSRPVITNLFSLTGCGKTALIRSLVQKLGFQTKFVEIQMDGISNGASGNETSICAILEESSIREGEQGIILLDEFQRFRTIDERGMDIKVERYNDVWMLLSDGKFPNDYSYLSRLETRLNRYEYWDDEYDAIKAEQAAQADEPPPEKKYKRALSYVRKYFLSPDDAIHIKSILRHKDTVKEIMMWPKEKVRAILRETIENKSNPPIDYSKCLVFIAGNLDEAFQMADEIEDCDTNADVFRDYTLKIGTIEIKKALARRFKPEQIARLGNNHIIYPSLSADAYLNIIKRSCSQYIESAHNICDIKFSIRPDVYQEIYDNSVYPTQGTRPVFTSVHKIFGYPLSDAILWGLSIRAKNIEIGLDIQNSSITFYADGHKKSIKVDLEMRARRGKHSDDFNALVAVHEAGHALVYAELFKTPPIEVAISIASFKGGYNRFSNEHLSKDETLNRMAVGMAGIVAEEIMFGQELRSTGCASDIRKTTELAGKYVRCYAMDGFNSHIDNEYQTSLHNTNLNDTNEVIEQLVTAQKDRAQTILTKYRDILVNLSRHLLEVKKMNATDFVTYLDGKIEGIKPLIDKDVNGDYATRLKKA